MCTGTPRAASPFQQHPAKVQDRLQWILARCDLARPEDSPQQVVEQGDDRKADEERDSNSGVQEGDVRTAGARQQ